MAYGRSIGAVSTTPKTHDPVRDYEDMLFRRRLKRCRTFEEMFAVGCREFERMLRRAGKKSRL